MGTSASFNGLEGITIDAQGNLFVADNGNNLVRKITPAGAVTTFESGLNNPTAITTDLRGNFYVSETSLIKKISSSGAVSTVAGSAKEGITDGVGINATFSIISGLALDGKGNLYVTDTETNRIRKIAL
jgi:sugar lactone lactonase YvrE